MTNNRLLLWSLIAFGAYFASGWVLPGPYISSAASLTLLIFASVTAIRYVPEAWRIVVNGKRGLESDGAAHWAAYGVALISLGSVYIGVFGLAWVAAGSPQEWLSTVWSGFGRAMCGAGFALLFVSPDVSRGRFRLPLTWWVISVIVVVLAAVFFLGVNIGEKRADVTANFRYSSYAPECPMSRPIKGNKTASGKIYHEPSGLYYRVTVPKECFRSVQEAQAAGFRPSR